MDAAVFHLARPSASPRAAFPYAAAHDVYHSFPALFCAGDSRTVERSFVTCFRHGGVATVTRVSTQLPQLDAAAQGVAYRRPQAAGNRPNPYP